MGRTSSSIHGSACPPRTSTGAPSGSPCTPRCRPCGAASGCPQQGSKRISQTAPPCGYRLSRASFSPPSRRTPESRRYVPTTLQELRSPPRCLTRGIDGALLRVGVLDLALLNLFEGHRQVVLRARLHERGQKLVEGALAELVVVVVDLPGALRRDDHQRIAGIDVLEQFVNAGMDHGREWYLRSATPGERSPPARPAPVRDRRSRSGTGTRAPARAAAPRRRAAARSPLRSRSPGSAAAARAPPCSARSRRSSPHRGPGCGRPARRRSRSRAAGHGPRRESGRARTRASPTGSPPPRAA